MKKLPLLILCLLFTAYVFAQHPSHQYIIHIYPTAGSTDKPLDEVTIKYGESAIQTEDGKVTILTDAATINSIASYIRANIKSHLPAANPDAECFGVILYAQTALVTRYYLNSHTQSKAYFKQFIASLTARHADKNVIGEVQKIYSRLNY